MTATCNNIKTDERCSRNSHNWFHVDNDGFNDGYSDNGDDDGDDDGDGDNGDDDVNGDYDDETFSGGCSIGQVRSLLQGSFFYLQVFYHLIAEVKEIIMCQSNEFYLSLETDIWRRMRIHEGAKGFWFPQTLIN